MIAPFFDAKKDGPITVNLNFLTMDGNDPAGTGARSKGPIRSGKKENISHFRSPDMVRDNVAITSQEPGAKNGARHIDTGLHGPVGHSGDSAAHGNVSSASSGIGQGDMKTLNYSRPGGADERHFSFIRETIMQGITYPERARRMGWEGKVVLSFIVRENGSIDDVKVVNSSGFPVLDENARETIAKTSFRKKVPVRLYVLLPVEYKLR